MPEQTFIGVPTAPGIAIGEVIIHRRALPEFNSYSIDPGRRAREIDRLNMGIAETRSQLTKVAVELSRFAGDMATQIFDAQTAILEDEEFTHEIRCGILEGGLNAESTVHMTAESWQLRLGGLEDERFRQRAQDVRDVSARLIMNLMGQKDGRMKRLEKPGILIAKDLMPSDVAQLMRGHVRGVVTEFGGATSHTAILTRALEVPAVVGLKDFTQAARSGDNIIVNGNSGKVILNPTAQTRREYTAKRRSFQAYHKGLSGIEKLPAVTVDGHRVALRANIELAQEVKAVLAHGGEGVGLFRSEYMFLTRKSLPSEEFQTAEYRRVIEGVAPHPVTIRTFDLGGDKVFAESPHPAEANPFMGWRAIRVSLDQPQLLRMQLRAIMRAAVAGNTRIMFPMVSGLEEVRLIRQHLDAVRSELETLGAAFNPDLEIGVMIELPSAVMLADTIARKVDFFSIGTNDLTQFTLAVDRGNERVRNLFQPLHPAMIRMIRMTVEAAHAAGIEVAMCGEMAASPIATMLLIGLGLDELSVSPVALPEIKKIVRSLDYADAVKFADGAFEVDTADELKDYCSREMKRRFADLPIWFSA